MESRENSSSKSLISLLTIQTLHSVLGLFILFFSACTLGLAQSKKEQIAVLTTQRDSIQEVMNNCAFQRDSISALLSQSRNQNQSDLEKWQNEKKQLQSKIDEWKQKAELAQMELYATKQQVESLTKRVDSLVLASRAMGELLKPIGEGFELGETNECSVEEYIFNSSNIHFPVPENYNSNYTRIMPIGFNSSGVFVYFQWMDSACGFCGVQLSIYFTETGISKEIASYDLMNEDIDECQILKTLKNDVNKAIQVNGLTPVSKMNMYYNDLYCNQFKLLGRIFSVAYSNADSRGIERIGQIICKTEKENEVVLKDVKLKKWSHEYFEDMVCEEDLGFQGYFYNPLNPSQIILLANHAIPCGFEAETDHYVFLVTLPRD
jgi:hypothetical protein